MEDRRFYRHPGIDPIGLARAVVRDIQQGSRAEGASTLTQQLARTLFLSNVKSYGRKLREGKAETVLAVIAPQIETQTSELPSRIAAPAAPETSVETPPPEAAVKARRKPAARSPRPRKTETIADGEG